MERLTLVFPSYIFLFAFLPIVLLLWHSRMPLRLRLGLLTLASYVFYGWWDYRFVALLVASTVIDYWCGERIHTETETHLRRRYLLASLTANLSFLGFFKYYDFFVDSGASVLSAFGWEVSAPILHIVLPIGISFYTFQSLSYSLDIYRRVANPAPNLLHFAAYVSLFPQLVAGPIVRYELMAEQLRNLAQRRIGLTQPVNGLWFFIIGLSKKLLLADRIAPVADRLFDGASAIETGTAWAGSLAYTLQLYFDFSAYSDMAIGLGLMLGFRFPVNFLSPYKSRNISDFWNRWHITLSHFLRDYLFIPLGGSRVGTSRTLRNLIITMLLGGLWHGAQWTFVVWGLVHGFFLASHALYSRVIGRELPRPIAVAITFLCVHFAWVLFRAPSFERAGDIYRGLLGLNGTENLFALTVESMTFGRLPAFVDIFGAPEILPFFVAGLLIVFFAPNSMEMRRRFDVKTALILAALFIVCIGSLANEVPFIYFQF